MAGNDQVRRFFFGHAVLISCWFFSLSRWLCGSVLSFSERLMPASVSEWIIWNLQWQLNFVRRLLLWPQKCVCVCEISGNYSGCYSAQCPALEIDGCSQQHIGMQYGCLSMSFALTNHCFQAVSVNHAGQRRTFGCRDRDELFFIVLSRNTFRMCRFDHAYWSVDAKDPGFAGQDSVFNQKPKAFIHR